jgi:hypothetical protein
MTDSPPAYCLRPPNAGGLPDFCGRYDIQHGKNRFQSLMAQTSNPLPALISRAFISAFNMLRKSYHRVFGRAHIRGSGPRWVGKYINRNHKSLSCVGDIIGVPAKDVISQGRCRRGTPPPARSDFAKECLAIKLLGEQFSCQTRKSFVFNKSGRCRSAERLPTLRVSKDCRPSRAKCFACAIKGNIHFLGSCAGKVNEINGLRRAILNHSLRGVKSLVIDVLTSANVTSCSARRLARDQRRGAKTRNRFHQTQVFSPSSALRHLLQTVALQLVTFEVQIASFRLYCHLPELLYP